MRASSKNPLATTFWWVGAYVLAVMICRWTGISSQPEAQAFLSSISNLIPSINTHAAISPNPGKAAFELGLGWLFSIPAFAYFFRALDWGVINENTKQKGGPFRVGWLLLLGGIVLLAVVVLPSAPRSEGGRFSRMFFRLYESDLAYVHGAGIVLIVSAALTFLMVGTIYLYQLIAKQGNEK